MPKHSRTLALPALAALALAGCGRSQPTTEAERAPEAAAAVPVPLPSPTATAVPGQLVKVEDKGEAGARKVYGAWKVAMEGERYAEAYGQFGDGGPADGMSAGEYTTQFGRCHEISIAAGDGQMEGAAGSLIYTVPTTLTCEVITGAHEKWTGKVVLKRVNDVPGASEQQLRWHLTSVTLKPND